MKKQIINISKYLLFLALGIYIFWKLYRQTDIEDIKSGFRDANYFWIFISIVFAVLSQVARALRWMMLMKPIGHKPRFINTFLSIFVMYFVNLLAPRAGEVARCSVLDRTDNVPFTKLVGTVIVERLADTVMLLFLAVVIFAMNFDVVSRFFEAHPEMLAGITRLITPLNIILLLLTGLVSIALVFFIIKRARAKKTTEVKEGKLYHIKGQFIDGIKTILKLDKPGLFIGYTVFIFLMWLLMLYVVFLAYEPTAHLTIRIGMIVFLMGGLAMLVPVQGGIGPWHFMVYQTLLLYNIPIENGKIFAIIAHTTTNLVYILLGAIAFILVLALNRNMLNAKKQPQRG